MLRSFFRLVACSPCALVGALSVGALIAVASAERAAADDTPTTKTPASASPGSAYNWNGFYAGGQLGYAWGQSNWTASEPGAPNISGSFGLAQPVDIFSESGSFFGGLQAGYNYMLPNRVVIGAEVDATFPSFPDLSRISIGGISNLTSPTLGAETFSETVLASGTVRGRIGYAPGSWLLYATGGFAWTYDRLSLTQLGTGTTASPFLWRLGYAAGAGVEAPVAPHWTARLEYLFTDYGNSGTSFFGGAQRFNSDFSVQQVRAGLNYQFGSRRCAGEHVADPHQRTGGIRPGFGQFPRPSHVRVARISGDPIALSGSEQLTGRWPGPRDGGRLAVCRRPVMARRRILDRSGHRSGLRPGKHARRRRLPERGSLQSRRRLSLCPRVSAPSCVRPSISVAIRKSLEADINQFAGSQTANRLVLWLGRFSVVDVFDTNKYANSPKTDFLNWSLVNAGTFDYAADGWGYTYGGAAEWYQGRFALRAGVFDLSETPTGGTAPNGLNLDPTFSQFQLVGEIEERHELWGQPGKIKVTGFLSRGRAGLFADAIALAQATGMPADTGLVRNHYNSRTGISVNLEQQITETLGVFARGGWADGTIEPWDFTDADRTASGGVSINGKQWGRPDDTIGIGGVVNGIAGIHQAYFNAGGTGILIGDGQLPHPSVEGIVEAYYSYALTASTRVSVDYQFVANPGYNTDRGPVNVFAGRLHWQF